MVVAFATIAQKAAAIDARAEKALRAANQEAAAGAQKREKRSRYPNERNIAPFAGLNRAARRDWMREGPVAQTRKRQNLSAARMARKGAERRRHGK